MVASKKVGFTIEQFIINQQSCHPGASGTLSLILYDIALAAKIISREVNKAGLVSILGYTGEDNVHGEAVKNVDAFSNNVMIKSMENTGRLCGMVSEESEEIIPIPLEYDLGPYVIVFDPLDGSSNMDVNVSIGTIFSIYRKIDLDGKKACEKDFLQPGNKLVAAGYVIYGSSTMLVYSTGNGVHGFTLDPSIGEFLLSHEKIQIPKHCKYYSVNESYFELFPKPIKDYISCLKPKNASELGTKASLRYIGSLVSDFHRNLLDGGIYLYPPTDNSPQGKLRLLYECIPLAFIAKSAGGYASNGYQDLLTIEADNIHQRSPLYIGNEKEVRELENILREHT
ncbi:MAG: class 1 fructose-bisphosphatase [Pseudomonadota bacterium]